MESLVMNIFSGGISLLQGMGVTIKAFFRPVVTVRYPKETIQMTARYRGHTKLIGDEENPERTKCVACGICVKACPSHSIKTVEGEKKEGEKKKVATTYILDFTTCSHCGNCVEACPFDALTFSGDYNPVGYTREDFYYDLVKEYEKRALKK